MAKGRGSVKKIQPQLIEYSGPDCITRVPLMCYQARKDRVGGTDQPPPLAITGKISKLDDLLTQQKFFLCPFSRAKSDESI
jgi:hypothetical protein